MSRVGGPRALALPGVHEALLQRIGEVEPCAALDLPAGPGALSAELQRLGFDVTPADAEPSGFDVPGLACDALDFDGPLPYPDGAFGLVVCAEGIEHSENAYHLVRELTRVLRPGGRLLLSTPNPLNLAARLRWFVSGFDDVSPRPIRHDEARLSMHHINPISLPFLELMFRRNGLRLLDVRANRLRTSAIAIGVLTWPVVWLGTWWALRGAGRPDPMPAVHRRVRDLLLSPAALFGRVLVFEAVKPER